MSLRCLALNNSRRVQGRALARTALTYGTSPPARPSLLGWQQPSVASHAVHSPSAVLARTSAAPTSTAGRVPNARLTVGMMLTE